MSLLGSLLRRRWLGNAVVLVAAVAVGLALVVGIARLTGIDLGHRLRVFAAFQAFPLHRLDDVYGWVPKDDARVRHTWDERYTATYTTDRYGHRTTPGGYDRPQVIVLGDSYTFGLGVEDEQTFAYLLGEQLPQVKIVNTAAMGWGTLHALLRLEQELARLERPVLVTYNFIVDHLRRNWLRRQWLASPPAVKPWAKVVDDRVLFQGLADPEALGLPEAPATFRAEREVTVALVRALKARCDAAGLPLHVFDLDDERYYTDGGVYAGVTDELRAIVGADRWHDVQRRGEAVTYRLPGKPHPDPQGHRWLATQMAPVLRTALNGAAFDR